MRVPGGRGSAAVACIVALVGSTLSLRFLTAPFVWICALWLVVSVLVALVGRRSGVKWAASNAAVALLLLGGLEYYLYSTRQLPAPRDEARDLQGRVVTRARPDPVRGWAPLPDRVVRWKRVLGEQVIFDVTYTIDGNGLRITGPRSEGGREHCVLFFGGSFTFGAGVNDQQTMPYRVGGRIGADYRVYNFGYSGYGAHQMLALLRHGVVERTVDCEPRYAVYQAIKGHVGRAANKVPWARHGPRFERNDAGEAVQVGRLEDEAAPAPAGIRAQLGKSFLVQRLRSRVTTADVELYVAIVASARREFERRWPGAEFHVLFWDYGDSLSDRTMEGLDAAGLRLHRISRILPELQTNRGRYVLGEHDLHPNPEAHARIATYVAEQIIERDRRQAGGRRHTGHGDERSPRRCASDDRREDQGSGLGSGDGSASGQTPPGGFSTSCS